jgi:hypothetical protein
MPNYHQGHDGVFFSAEAIEEYLRSEEICRQLRQKVFDTSLEKLSRGQYAVAKMGRKTHYITLTPENEIVAACCGWHSISLDTIKKCHYNPFVEEIPSCHHCLTFKRMQANIETGEDMPVK